MAIATDWAAADRATATFAPEQIGRTRYRTPEGFLLCEGARIARTGPMLYTRDEVPDIEPGSGSMITMLRDADVLFDPETIQSFAGKPVTNEHPDEPVNPGTFRSVAVGTVLNPRRGEGVEAEYLIGDLLITDADAISAIEALKRELSAGYEVEVEQIQPGIGRQTKIIGNHVALVGRGRAGPSCSIQDEEPTMAKRTTRILDGIRKAFRAKDEAALEKELEKAESAMDEDEPGEGQEHRLVIELKPPEAKEEPAADEGAGGSEEEQAPAWFSAYAEKTDAAIATLGEAVKKLAAAEQSESTEEVGDEDPEEKKEEEKEADKTTAKDAMAKAEILAPGIRLPVTDAASGPLKNAGLTALRRSALKTAMADAGRKAHVEAVMGGRTADFDKMAPAQVAMVFDAAAAVARVANNSGGGRKFDVPQGPMTAAKYQANIEERRKQRA